MRFNKKQTILFLVIILSLGYLSTTITPNSFISNLRNEKIPNLSDPNLTIITPINDTISSPTNGYYPDTYGFENDLASQDPLEWSDNSGGTCTVQIISSLGGHNNVMELYDGDGNAAITRNDLDSSQTSGTVEYWVRQSSNTRWSNFWMYQTGGTVLFAVSMNNTGGLVFVGSGANYWMQNYNGDTWYHIRVDFECGSGSYMGLAADNAYVYVNGVQYGSFPFQNSVATTDYVEFRTESTLSSYYNYIDAIGYSWDPNYNIGDNSKEGLLLSYENSTVLDWQGYSLDGAANRTILGNTTIPMPNVGLHSIQVFGNETSGTMYNSGTRHFHINNISTIISPENKQYNNGTAGYFQSTYGFENSIENNDPIGWTDLSGGSCTVQTISSLSGHNKVMELYDADGSAAIIRNDLDSSQTNGTVEYWVRQSANTRWSNFWMYQAGGMVLFAVTLNNTGGLVFVGSGANYWMQDYSGDTWYHIRADFECGSGSYMGLAADTAYVYVNGTKYGPFPFQNSVATTDYVEFRTESTLSSYYTYIDAVGYSWDSAYDIGDNLEEGILLSFNNYTNLDWIGYSLDGQPNKTIYGNTTLPIPTNGLHSLRVFGNDTYGTMYSTPIRYFTTTILPEDELPGDNPPGDTPPGDTPGIPGYDILLLSGLIISSVLLIILKRKR